MSDDRAAFEAMMKKAGYGYSEPLTYPSGDYRSICWQAAWEAYRAGMRAGIERAAEVCEAVRESPARSTRTRPVADLCVRAIRALEGK